MNDKQQWRDNLIQRRLALPMVEVRRRSAAIVAKIRQASFFLDAKLVALYYPINHEVDLRALFKSDKRIALPKIVDGEMHFIEIDSFTDLETSRFGIKEPIKGPIVDDEIDLLLVPSIAIDKENYRIGYGKAYFDRYLAKHKTKHKYGIIYDFQLVSSFEHGPQDIPLDGALIG